MSSPKTAIIAVSLIFVGGTALLWGGPHYIKSQLKASELKMRPGETVTQTDARLLPVGGPYHLWDPAQNECFSVEKIGHSPHSLFDYVSSIPCTDSIRDEVRNRMQGYNQKLGITAEDDPRPL